MGSFLSHQAAASSSAAPSCYVAGHCRGKLSSHAPSPGAEHCLYSCKRDEGCGWWAFKAEEEGGHKGHKDHQGICLLFESCNHWPPTAKEGKKYANYVSGEKG